MSEQQRFIQIDEEGYFLFDGNRVTDEDYGRDLLKNLFIDDRGRVLCRTAGQEAKVEAFDEPLVAANVEHGTAGNWSLILPYQHQEKFKLETLSLDEWDRFHGRTDRGLPFVFSRAAQAEFFNLLEEFDDDSISADGKTYSVEPWLPPNSQAREEKFWSTIYQNQKPAWDLEQPHPALPISVPQLKLTKSRILVLGAGLGHDAAYFAQQGHIVTAVDFSAEAITQAKQKFASQSNLQFMQADALKLPSSFDSQFDIVFEHTLYCAIDPEERNEIVRSWRRALTENGFLLGIFEVHSSRTGPPFGGSEWELRSRFQKSFRALYWTRLKVGPPHRLGSEVLIYAQKRNRL